VTASLTDDDKIAAAARFLQATRRGGDAFAALCAPGAVTWHNFDDAEVPASKTAATLDWLHRTVADLDWVELAVLPTADGFVARTLMTGTAPGGPLRAHSCVIATLDADGRITRLEEYLDPAQTAALRS
jgi:ketosteroid isomerase-like protein